MLAKQIADLLNKLLVLDPAAIDKLIEQRVECNFALAASQLVAIHKADDGKLMLGPLGLLNALLDLDKEWLMFRRTTGGGLCFTAVTVDEHPEFFGPVMPLRSYLLKPDGSVEIETKVVPLMVGDPLYEATKSHAEANGVPACGVQLDNKQTGIKSEIQVIAIPLTQ